ncbi:MAG: hypothetical protein AMXMBFR20_15300 [Planctomycetia bacterium]
MKCVAGILFVAYDSPGHGQHRAGMLVRKNRKGIIVLGAKTGEEGFLGCLVDGTVR